MLRKIRIVLASLCFVGITLLFLDFTGTAHAWLGYLARVQLVPALLALHVGDRKSTRLNSSHWS